MRRGPRQTYCKTCPSPDAVGTPMAPKQRRPLPSCGGGPGYHTGKEAGGPGNPTAKEAPALMQRGPRLSHRKNDPYLDAVGAPMAPKQRRP